MKLRKLFLSILTLLVMLPAQAITGETRKEQEINYLLSFISQSDCIFIRNGTEHSAKEALKHIEKKYDYFRSDIDKAEDFIDLAATKSSFSGKQYNVACGKKKMTSQQWLLAALRDYRSSHPQQ